MASVSGRCVDASGTPVPGAYVYAVPATGARFGRNVGTHTDATGRWMLQLPPGRWQIRETGHAAYELVVSTASITTETPSPSKVATPKSDPAELDDIKLRMQRRRARRAGAGDS